MQKKEVPNPTKEQLVRHKILIFLQSMDTYCNESNLYLEEVHNQIIKKIESEDEFWGFYDMFLHNYVQLTNTYKNLGEYLTKSEDDDLEIEEIKKDEETNNEIIN